MAWASGGSREEFRAFWGLPPLPNDALASNQYATYVEALGEGELGFPSAIDAGFTVGTSNYNTAALKDVYLNNTQVLNSSANPASATATDYNFQGINFNFRSGTSGQTYIPGISEIETENSVSVKVENGSPVTRSITNTSVTSARVTVIFPRMEFYTDEGNIDGSEVSLSIAVQYNGGGYTNVITDTVRGRTNNAYSRDYKVTLSGAFPVDIRVIRNTADSTDSKLHNEFHWSAYTEIIDQQRAYANTAHAALRFDAQNFPQTPARMYRLRGIKVKVPSNATVRSDGSLSFSGSWNGSFSATKVTTTCPSWILYDLLINERYGFGQHIAESQLDKYTFYSVSVYNNELINNGLGGTEPRFAFNGAIQNQTSAYKLISDICGAMRCMPYWSTGALTISQDSEKDASYLFTLANTVEGGFTYSGASAKTRATQINVSYFDNETKTKDWEEVSDIAMQAKWGIITKNITAYGCTSRGQANRLGKWALYTLFHESEIISFRTTLESAVCIACGDVINVADPVRSGLRRGGRISAATTTQITVDNADQTDLDATNNATLSVILPDGSLETKSITSIVGSVITVSAAFSATPNVNSVWVLANDTTETTQWRIISIAEEEKGIYTISALSYNSSKYAYIEDGSTLTTRTVSVLNEIPDPPSSVTATEQIYEENGAAKVKITVNWKPVKGVNQYLVRWKKGNGNYEQEQITSLEYQILDTTAGTYDISVYSINAALKPSATSSDISFAAVGKTAPPADVANLTFEAISSNSGRLRWDRSTELDVINGGGVKFKHSSDTTGAATWSNATSLIASKSGSQTEAIVPLVEGEMLVKFFDDGQRESTNATSVIVDLPDTLGALAVITQREDQLSPTPFSGTKTDVTYDSGYSALILEMLGFDGVASVDAITDFDDVGWGDVDASGTYNFASKLDLGAVYSLDLKRHFKVVGFLPDDEIDARAALVDTWGDWDGATNNVDAKLYVRTTNNDPASGGASWSSWQEFANGTHKARGFDFKTVLTSTDTDENIQVKELGYSATLQRRQEQSVAAVASGAGSKTINFSKPFFVGTSGLGGANAYLPSVGLQVNNLSSGDYIDGPTVTSSGFTFTIKNSSGSAIDKNFTWSAVGYGLGV